MGVMGALFTLSEVLKTFTSKKASRKKYGRLTEDCASPRSSKY
jgi:hypothetical protein